MATKLGFYRSAKHKIRGIYFQFCKFMQNYAYWIQTNFMKFHIDSFHKILSLNSKHLRKFLMCTLKKIFDVPMSVSMTVSMSKTAKNI
jgi:hypothetical protein